MMQKYVHFDGNYSNVLRKCLKGLLHGLSIVGYDLLMIWSVALELPM